jgi:hypothetical protein
VDVDCTRAVVPVTIQHVFGLFDLAALAQPHLEFLFVCMMNVRAKPTVHPPRGKIGGTGNVCAYIATKITVKWLRQPRQLRCRHWCHMQPIMHRMQPMVFSKVH